MLIVLLPPLSVFHPAALRDQIHLRSCCSSPQAPCTPGSQNPSPALLPLREQSSGGPELRLQPSSPLGLTAHCLPFLTRAILSISSVCPTLSPFLFLSLSSFQNSSSVSAYCMAGSDLGPTFFLERYFLGPVSNVTISRKAVQLLLHGALSALGCFRLPSFPIWSLWVPCLDQQCQPSLRHQLWSFCTWAPLRPASEIAVFRPALPRCVATGIFFISSAQLPAGPPHWTFPRCQWTA